MGVEYELKFRCGADTKEKILSVLDGEKATYAMATTYFDTPSGQLSARRWTLRCRRENEKYVCTLKTPAQGSARREWETEEADIRKSLDKLCKLGAPEELKDLCREGLIPICGAEFTRIALTLPWGESVLEVALDGGILTGGGKTAPIAELEVELKAGKEADADRFAAYLAGKYGLTPEPASKFRRALALYRGE